MKINKDIPGFDTEVVTEEIEKYLFEIKQFKTIPHTIEYQMATVYKCDALIQLLKDLKASQNKTPTILETP